MRELQQLHTHSHTHFTALWTLSGITRVSRYRKGKTNMDFTEARDSEWQLYQLDHMQICTSPQTTMPASHHLTLSINHKLPNFTYLYVTTCLQCCWLSGRKGIRPVKTKWWDAGMVICLGQGADLHIAQLMAMPYRPTIFCSSKSRLV